MNETTCNDMEQARGIDNGTPLDVVTVDEAVIPFSEETIVPFVEQTDVSYSFPHSHSLLNVSDYGYSV